MPFVLAESFLTGIAGSLELEGNLVRFLVGGYFALVGTFLVVMATMILVDEKRRVTWGALVLAGNVMVGIIVIGFNAGTLILSNSALSAALTILGLVIGQALGVAGGLMAIYSRS
jgi:hypothetical protein